MRDYLYVWHDPDQQFIVASGIEFKDFVHSLGFRGGVLLIDHQYDYASYDTNTCFHFVQDSDIEGLAAEDIYSWGNFVWADYASPTFPSISDDEIAELLYFAHRAKPLHGVALPSLNNQFLGYEHDDGWYLRLYYTRWDCVEKLLARIVPASLGQLDLSELRRGTDGFWLQDGIVNTEEKTHDVDTIINRHV